MILLVAHGAIQEGDFEWSNGLQPEDRGRTCKDASDPVRLSERACGGLLPGFPFTDRVGKGKLSEQLSCDRECNGSHRVWGWRMAAMTLQSILHGPLLMDDKLSPFSCKQMK